jgi:hypothetical protein
MLCIIKLSLSYIGLFYFIPIDYNNPVTIFVCGLRFERRGSQIFSSLAALPAQIIILVDIARSDAL